MNIITRWANLYFALMNKAKVRGKPDGYCERHHIEPRCVGGSDCKENRVWLTAREHLLAHKLWVRMELDPVRKRKAQNALWAMAALKSPSTSGRRTLSSREFELARIELKRSKTGVKRSHETNQKISASLKRYFAENGCHNSGRSYSHLTQEERDKLFGDKNRGRVQSAEERERRAAKLRKPRSAEARERIRLGALKREAAKRAKLTAPK